MRSARARSFGRPSDQPRPQASSRWHRSISDPIWLKLTRSSSLPARRAAISRQRGAERDRYQTAAKDRAERLLRIAQLAYKEGARGILELVDAYRTTHEVRLRDLELRALLDEAGFDVAEAVGDLTAVKIAASP